MMSESNQVIQSKGKYILAWIVMAILHKIIGFVVELIVMGLDFNSLNILNYIWLIDACVMVASSVLIFKIVYFKIFNNLDAKKVLIYLYTLGTLGVVFSIGRTLKVIDEMGLINKFDSFVYSWAVIFAWILSVLIIRHFVYSRTKKLLVEKPAGNAHDLRNL